MYKILCHSLVDIDRKTCYVLARIDKIRSKLREVRGRNMWKIKEWFLHYKEAIRVSLLALFR